MNAWQWPLCALAGIVTLACLLSALVPKSKRGKRRVRVYLGPPSHSVGRDAYADRKGIRR